jgi:uncharacterized membrane protein
VSSFRQTIEAVVLVIDVLGVLIIVLGILFAGARLALRRAADSFRQLRQDLGRGILLGLEVLIAADIIRSVAVTPTLEGVMVLGLIVLIRTFLSVALQVEIEGKWPWQRAGVEREG